MYRYPFHKIAAFGIGLGICVGCNPTDVTDPATMQAEPTEYEQSKEAETATTSLNMHIDAGSPLLVDYVIGPMEPTTDETDTKGFEINTDLGELTTAPLGGILAPCQVEQMRIENFLNAYPVEIDWLEGQGISYELLIDIQDPEFKRNVGQIFQTSTGMIEVDISDKLQTGHDYVLDIEFVNVDTNEICISDGLIRFDPEQEL